MGAPLSRATQPLEGEQDSEQPCKRLRPELREEDRTVVDPFEGEDRAFEAVPLHWQSSSAPTEHQQAHSLPGAGQAVLAIESHAHDRFNEVAKAELLARGLQNKAVQVAMRLTNVAMAEAISLRREAERAASERSEDVDLVWRYVQRQTRQKAAAVRREAEANACELCRASEAEAIHKSYTRTMPPPPPSCMSLSVSPAAASVCRDPSPAIMLGSRSVYLVANSESATPSALTSSAPVPAPILFGSGPSAVPSVLARQGCHPAGFGASPMIDGALCGSCALLPPFMPPPATRALGCLGFASGTPPAEGHSGDRRSFRKARRPQR